MNNVNLIGRLTKDIELRQTESGKSVCSFCIAVDGAKETTYFIDCVAWEARAINIAKYFHKGDKIGIAGLLTTRMYETSDGSNRKAVEVLINSFDFCNGKKTEHNEEPTRTETSSVVEDATNDIPFEI